jgi:hypothetical protein
MRKWITLLMTLLVGASVSSANATGQVSFEAGYRHDNIRWKQEIPSDHPVIKEETKFKDRDIFQFGLHGRSTVGCNFYVRGSAYWGWILDGDFDRSFETAFNHNYFFDFAPERFGHGALDNRRDNVIDDKYVYGLNAAIGYPFYFCDCTFILAPVVGYAFDEQNINLDDRNVEVDLYRDVLFGVDGNNCCERKWINKWWGPFVGIDFNYRPYNECWNLYAEFEYHWAHFNGKRNVDSPRGDYFFETSNLNTKSKFHSHDATGLVVSVGADYDLCNCWTLGLSFKWQDWTARRHKKEDCNRFVDYFFSEHCNHRLKQTFKWQSYAVNLTIGREF